MMSRDLPESLQKQIIRYLEANDFKSAKKLRDMFLQEVADKDNYIDDTLTLDGSN
jgi:hypothetical protein